MENLDEMLWDYLDDEIEPEEKDNIYRLIRNNLEVRKRYEYLKNFNNLLASTLFTNKNDLSPNFEENLVKLVNAYDCKIKRKNLTRVLFIFLPTIIFVLLSYYAISKVWGFQNIINNINFNLRYLILSAMMIMIIALLPLIIKVMEFKLQNQENIGS